MNKITIKMTITEAFERNFKKEKRLKELWNVCVLANHLMLML